MLKVHARNLGNVAVLRFRGRIVNGETEILHEAVDSVRKATPSYLIWRVSVLSMPAAWSAAGIARAG